MKKIAALAMLIMILSVFVAGSTADDPLTSYTYIFRLVNIAEKTNQKAPSLPAEMVIIIGENAMITFQFGESIISLMVDNATCQVKNILIPFDIENPSVSVISAVAALRMSITEASLYDMANETLRDLYIEKLTAPVIEIRAALLNGSEYSDGKFRYDTNCRLT